MNKQDFIDGWKKLKTFYPRLPDIESEIERGQRATIDAWLEIVGRFRRDTWLEGITKCVKKERYAPTPAVLMEYCFAASREIQEQERERAASLSDGAECRWCGGGGWIFVEEDGEWPTCFACCCGNSREPERGKMILDKALADKAWEFCQSDHTFRPRRRWVGDPMVSEAAVRTAFRQDKVGELF